MSTFVQRYFDLLLRPEAFVEKLLQDKSLLHQFSSAVVNEPILGQVLEVQPDLSSELFQYRCALAKDIRKKGQISEIKTFALAGFYIIGCFARAHKIDHYMQTILGDLRDCSDEEEIF